MTEWRERGFWSKAWIYALLGLLVAASDGADLSCLGGGSNRKRVFSPGFILLCVFVVVLELMVLSHWYGVI
ncbi:hypothetical protein N436_01978 [Pseudomonas sp. RV120224-01b]|nr:MULTISPECIES: hypothetical protein [unclassified Pseudomonas]PYG79869.1 hypothetical protein N428_02194 [Pseudomonas sp. RV120224-01c]PYG83627.1 hypothetical protein N436_01978 [Pseudomonas sp. RV120224-01b]